MPEYCDQYDSIADLAAAAKPHVISGTFPPNGLNRKFYGVDTWQEAETLSVNGWDDESAAAMSVAQSAIETVSKEHDMPAFSMRWDVSGCEVDVARYLSGEPENMIDYDLVPSTRFGRVIVLCASIAVSSAISVTTIKRRGQSITALALALNALGYATEIWADSSTGGSDNHIGRSRTLVKGANDELDAARIMFAFSHPTFARVLALATMHEFPKSFHRPLNVGSSYGTPVDAKKDLPDGTIYLPCLRSNRDVPDADVALLGYLRELGIVQD